jgi:hypothetical protein
MELAWVVEMYNQLGQLGQLGQFAHYARWTGLAADHCCGRR